MKYDDYHCYDNQDYHTKVSHVTRWRALPGGLHALSLAVCGRHPTAASLDQNGIPATACHLDVCYAAHHSKV